MNASVAVMITVALLAAGTFALRFAGPALRTRAGVPVRTEKLMGTAAVVLLVAVAATSALTEDQGAAGIARPVGVLVGGVLAWRKAPFVVAVVAAAVVAAGLRLLGVP
ncbi:AzlD domain-containing protein [Rhodococcus tukisamuensis]|uniref:Branched-chain amino acid transport protein (AzlD) n=1 Tax=Rhodococcus tukisamuensis TaxID=168276 RepID=A0A1G6S9Y2_9NOCA|nr:AzlD domain-containing protein [Rhodococcus tukisamuensis]SDD13481.1 Branched-chain amino acid transport protein (AzlD) [Rhodococcus tukisamuensis]